MVEAQPENSISERITGKLIGLVTDPDFSGHASDIRTLAVSVRTSGQISQEQFALFMRKLSDLTAGGTRQEEVTEKDPASAY